MTKTSEEMSALIGQLNVINERLEEEYPDLEGLDNIEFRGFRDLCNKKQMILHKIELLKEKEAKDFNG